MKKLILLSLILISISSFAQNKPVYKRIVIFEEVDAKNLLLALDNWYRLIPYDPDLTPENALKSYKELYDYRKQMPL